MKYNKGNNYKIEVFITSIVKIFFGGHMKTNIFLLVIITSCLSFFQISCLSPPRWNIVESVFDPSILVSQSAKILFVLEVQSYNGIDIYNAWLPKPFDRSLVTIPAGKSSFTFPAYFFRHYGGNHTVAYTINDCKFNYNFEGGKEYTVVRFLEKKPKPAKLLAIQEYMFYVRIYGKIPSNPAKIRGELSENDLLASIFILDTEDYQ